jgi:flagellar protein FliO/FliZ
MKTKWKVAAVLLGLLALGPFFVAGSGATAIKGALAICAIGFVVAAGIRRQRKPPSSGATPFRLVSRSSLSPRTGIAVVEFEGRRLLVGFGDGFTQVLSTAGARRPRRSKKGG